MRVLSEDVRQRAVKLVVEDGLQSYRKGLLKAQGPAQKGRSPNRKTQPTGSSIMGFYFMDKPELFMRVTLKKPNPYIGYVVARVFENTKRGERLRTHPDFPAFAEQVGLLKAWKRYGWPEQICRDWFADLAEENHVSSLSPSDALM